jgi:hypothetical protein
MPAFFAYLLVVALLLGGGYGALNWLAAPEPVKVAEAKPRAHARTGSEAKPSEAKPPEAKPSEANPSEAKPSEAKPSQAKPSEAKSPDANSVAINGNDNDKAAGVSINQPSPSVPEAASASSEQRAPASAPGPAAAAAPDPKTRSANADVLSREAEKHNATSSSPAESGHGATQQSSEVGPSSAQAPSAAAPAAAARRLARPRIRQADRHSGKGALALMTLQTIEYPDGRRVTRLIPYRGDSYRGDVRPLSFQSDE